MCVIMIERAIERLIEKRWTDNKALIILGPRQVGKTTLLSQLREKNEGVVWLNGDDFEVRKLLASPSAKQLAALIGGNRILIVDEAQRIENIGICLKLIIDNMPNVKVVASGSSAFELANRINEPLTGRKWEFRMFPISYSEMVQHHGLLDEMGLLKHRLVYGYYPDVINNPGDEKAILGQLADSYLYKDILTWERVLKPDKLEKLVQALAFQVGHQVSYNELGQMTGLNSATVENYVQLLEKAFIVFRLPSFSRNLRNELKRSRKIYFYDNGLRNAVIQSFNTIELRNDTGALWENFLVSERMKHLHYSGLSCNRYFWRNHAQREVDYLEERDGELCAYEFKWSAKQKVKFPKAFLDAYEPTETKVIHSDNYQDFIL